MYWIDLDNTPHVPLFRPILAELHKKGKEAFVTSRLHAQTEDLLRMWNIPHTAVGEHGGKSLVKKIVNLFERSQQLMKVAKGKSVDLALSHGSRTHMVAAARLRIPYIELIDYEYSEQHLANWIADWILMPSFIPESRVREAGINIRKVLRYEGFKEEMYLKDFVPNPDFRKSIDIDPAVVLVTLRPPSVTANYHDKRSEVLFRTCLARLQSSDNMLGLVVNRTQAERGLIPDAMLQTGKIRLLEKPVDGLQLLWHSDAVVSGGGTMNRESALLGVPTYSIFTGRRPAMDEHLRDIGKLTFLENPMQIESLAFAKRQIGTVYTPTNVKLAEWVTDLIISLTKPRAGR